MRADTRLLLACTPALQVQRLIGVIAAIATLLLAGGCASAPPSRSPQAPALAPTPGTVDIGDTRLHVLEAGRGTPVIFVHGAGGDWRTWEPLRPRVSAAYRFVSYSRRYHWPNDPAGGGRPYTVPEQAADLIALVEALRAGPVHAVGGSYGARVVLDAALRRPDLFKSIAVSEPFITPPVDPAQAAAAKALADDLARIAEPLRTGDTAAATAQLVKAVTGDPQGWQRLAPEARQRFMNNQTTWLPLARAPAVAPTACADLARLKVPVLVIEGEQTVAGFRVTNDRLMACLPQGAQRFVVPHAPHIWYPVNPDAAAQRLLSFMGNIRP